MTKIIEGGKFSDHRGCIRFVNSFDMSDVKRFYLIRNYDLEFIRGWRAHRVESRWFFPTIGKFEIACVKLDRWDRPSQDLKVEYYVLDCEDQNILHIPPGYGAAIKALELDSELLVFADSLMGDSKFDDYTFPIDYFKKF